VERVRGEKKGGRGGKKGNWATGRCSSLESRRRKRREGNFYYLRSGNSAILIGKREGGEKKEVGDDGSTGTFFLSGKRSRLF